VLAQSNLDGGGNTDANRQAKSPLPTDKDDAGTTVEMKTRKVRELEQEAQRLMTQLKSSSKAPVQEQKPQETVQPSPNALDLTELRSMAAKLDARIDKQIDAYQKRPNRLFVGARAKEYVLARYVEDWRAKVERIGNLNYPDQARQLRLYGSLRLTVHVNKDGSVEKIDIDQPSGHKVLDEAAVRIVRLASPFAPLPDSIRNEYGPVTLLGITRTWTFTKADQLVDSAGPQ
jgi:protein TonB